MLTGLCSSGRIISVCLHGQTLIILIFVRGIGSRAAHIMKTFEPKILQIFKEYNKKYFISDLIAGIIDAIIALPLFL